MNEDHWQRLMSALLDVSGLPYKKQAACIQVAAMLHLNFATSSRGNDFRVRMICDVRLVLYPRSRSDYNLGPNAVSKQVIA